MKNTITVLGLFVSTISIAQDPSLTWGHNFGGLQGAGFARITASEVMADGGVVNGGWYTEVVDLDNDPAAVDLQTALSGVDAFVQRLTPNGLTEWSVSFHGSGDVKVLDICADSEGNVFGTIKFEQSMDIDPGPGMLNIIAVGATTDSYDLVVVKLSPQGAYLAHRQFNDVLYDVAAAELEVDALDQPILAFNRDSREIHCHTLSNVDLSDVSAWYFGNTSASGQALLVEMRTDVEGNRLFTGRFSQQISMDPLDLLNVTPTNGNNFDIFYSKVNAGGSMLFGHAVGNTGSSESGYSITDGPGGITYVTGYFSGTVDMDPGPGLFNMTSAGGTDLFLTKLDASGAFVWAKQIGTSADEFGYCVRASDLGDLSLTGYLGSSGDVDPGPGEHTLAVASNSSMILQLNAQGAFNWARVLASGSHLNNPVDLSLFSDGGIAMGGSFSGAAIDRDPDAAYDPLLAQDGAAAFNFKWDYCEAVIPSINIGSSISPICPGVPVTFSATVANEGTMPVYEWSVNGSSVGTNSNAFQSDGLDNGDVISCSLASSADCATPNPVLSNTITVGCTTPGVLFFSEYVEGSANNKALEIHNPLGVPVDLSEYAIALYANGGNMPLQTQALNGTIDAGGYHVVAHPSASAPLLALADITSNVCNFNGNDAVALLHQGVPSDIIGEIGVDPGTNWMLPSGGATSEFTLRRLTSVDAPEADWNVAQFQWVAFPQDDISDLGMGLPTTVEDIEAASVLVWPNPVGTDFRVMMDTPARLRVLALNGSLILDLGVVRPGSTVQRGEMASGCYVLEAVDGPRTRRSLIMLK